jgi:hypothetical protein
MKCVICKQKIDQKEVKEELKHIFNQANMFGIDSLTENEQCVIEGKVCCYECFEKLT